MSKVQYSFPVLKSVDIVANMEALDFLSVTESDVTKPSAAVTMRIMEALCDNFLSTRYGQYGGIFDQDENLLQQLLEEVSDAPELHRDSVPLMCFYRKMYT